jgi:hypothetical protein
MTATRPAGVVSSLLWHLAICGMLGSCAPWSRATTPELAPSPEHSFARQGCTQEDLPATEIYLANSMRSGSGEPEPPFLRIELSGAAAPVELRRTFALTGLRRDAAVTRGGFARAALHLRGGAIEWLTGSIEVALANHAGARVVGNYRFTDSAGHEWAGKFEARVISGAATCG